MIVVDASIVTLAIAGDDVDGDTARNRLLEEPDLHAPHLVDLEVMSVLRRLHAAGEIESRRAALALDDLADLTLVRYPHWPLAPRIWELRPNLSPYDASYVALAESLRCALVTGDRRIARATGIRCEVEIL
ncbi:MAG: type II toxin-antitoxin system VapC family toxin [Actinomycetota bacterium]|nr:type II toxin-antitoxin system VapC family toxin [Actinomycetota bacterium]